MILTNHITQCIKNPNIFFVSALSDGIIVLDIFNIENPKILS